MARHASITLQAAPQGGRAAAPDLVAAHYLPLYVASALVTLCSAGAVAATVGETGFTQLVVGLTVLGHAASWWLRRRGVSLQALAWPVMLAGTLWLAFNVGTGGTGLGLTAPIASLPTDLIFGVCFAWLAVVRCFTLVSNGALLFSAVPGMALLGLMGSVNLNVEMPVFFALFLFGTIFLVSYEQHLQRSQQTGAAPLPFHHHVLSAAVLFGAALVLGGVFSLVGRPVLSPLTPYAFPAAMGQGSPGINNPAQVRRGQVFIGAGPITLSESEVFHIYSPQGGLWRSGVLEEYNGRGWSVSRRDRRRLESNQQVQAQLPRGFSEPDARIGAFYRYQLPPSGERTTPVPTERVSQTVVVRAPVLAQLPSLDRPVEVLYPRSIVQFDDSSGTVSLNAYISSGMTYQVVSDLPRITEAQLQSAKARHPYGSAGSPVLAIPEGLSRVRNLAAEITAPYGNDYDRTQAIIRWIEANCSYTLLEEQTPSGEDAVEYYLFGSKSGACGLAASAAVLMCRSVGIPARAVIGYMPDPAEAAGGPIVVRQRDSHMWLEVFLGEYGWVPFNPAPASRDLERGGLMGVFDQASTYVRKLFRGGLDTFLVAVVLLGLGFLGGQALWQAVRGMTRRWRAEREAIAHGGAPAVLALYRKAGRVLARGGWARDDAMTPWEYARRLERDWGADAPAVAPLRRLTEQFCRASYGGEVAKDAASQAEADLKQLQTQLPRKQNRTRARLWFRRRTA